MKQSFLFNSLFKNIGLLVLSFFTLGLGSTRAQKANGKGNLPIFSFYNSEKLAKALCKNATTEEEKVKAISAWICYHIKYDPRRYTKSSLKRYSPNRILWRKRALCDEYAELFNKMCAAVEVKCFTVDGYFKSANVEFDDTLYTSEHAWNLVKIGEQWELMDLTIASGYLVYAPTFLNRLNVLIFRPVTYSKLKFVRSLDTSQIFAEPRYFAALHLPSMPDFQKLDEPISLYDFQNCQNQKCYEQVETSAGAGTIEDFYHSSAKDKLIWHADSIISFNPRNQLVRVLDLHNAATEGMIELGYTSRKKELPTDVKELRKIITYLDSSTAAIPAARFYIQEEYYHRKIKNQYRHKLAQQTIKPVQSQNKRTLSFSKRIQIRNNRKIKNYAHVDENLLIQKANLLEQKPRLLKDEADSSAEWFKNEFNYNEKQISICLDSQKVILDKINDNLRIMTDSLLPVSYHKLDEIERFQDLIINLTQYSNILRIFHFDNLDAELTDAQHFRAMFNDSLKEAFLTRNQNMRECANLDLDNRDYLGILKQLHQKVKAMVDANANIGINNTAMYNQSLQLLCHTIDTLVNVHRPLVEYYAVEADWADPLLSKTRKQSRRLKAELAYEETRFLTKQKLISNRNLSYKKILTEVGKMNRGFKLELKAQVKKLSR